MVAQRCSSWEVHVQQPCVPRIEAEFRKSQRPKYILLYTSRACTICTFFYYGLYVLFVIHLNVLLFDYLFVHCIQAEFICLPDVLFTVYRQNFIGDAVYNMYFFFYGLYVLFIIYGLYVLFIYRQNFIGDAGTSALVQGLDVLARHVYYLQNIYMYFFFLCAWLDVLARRKFSKFNASDCFA